MDKIVFIMTASTGGGHNRAAKAIKEELEKLSNDHIKLRVSIIDSIKSVNNLVDKLISVGYEKSAKYTPSAYGKVYKISDSSLLSKFEHKDNILATIFALKYKKIIETCKPDIIIGTHPFPMIAMSKLKKKDLNDFTTSTYLKDVYNVMDPHMLNDLPNIHEKEKFPLMMTVLTDYTIHSTWVQNEVDHYIVGDEYVKEILVTNEGICEDQISSYGIPVEKSFLENRDRDTVMNELGFDPEKFTVLLMGGSFGAGNITDTLEELINVDRDFQILVIAGRNKNLLNKLNKKISNLITDKTIKILGFVSNMNDILSACDLLVTKPGGLTTTEALIKEIPMVIPYFIPGQEEENLDFFTNTGSAIKATNKFNVSVIVKVLYDNPDRLERIRENIRAIKKVDCAEKIAKLTYELITQDNKQTNEGDL